MRKQTTKGNKGAINAIRGYRLQALYSIQKILSHQDEKDQFIPEGFEDLDVFDKRNNLKECIQIKSTVNTLTFSNLFSESNIAFLNRLKELAVNESLPLVKVVCFGKISPSLNSLFSATTELQKFKNKFDKFKITNEELTFIKENIELISLSEEKVESEVLELIKAKQLAIDAQMAFKYLHHWLYYLSEKGGSISQESLLNEISSIGEFLSERENYHKHFHTSIKSIEELKIEQENASIEFDFYKGVAANYQHIVADLDVIRIEKLKQIEEGFKHNSTLVIHGASGQGKSALAYRYIHEYHNLLAYQITLFADQQTILEQIAALKAVGDSLTIPILLYIDVEPRNIHWIKILQEFSHYKYFKFLVTIREEDWNKTSNKGVDFSFSEVELTLNKEEAKTIFDRLLTLEDNKRFTDFEEAWILFGGDGPLLEFTYLIKQGETLESRLRSQISRIETEQAELVPLVKTVALADSLGAKLKLNALLESDRFPKLRLGIESLSKEYLLRITKDDQFLTGLHPIRSSILSGILHLNDQDLLKTFKANISCFSDDDLYLFLLRLFELIPKKRMEVADQTIKQQWTSFVSLNAVCNALIWLGIKEFVDNNRALLEEFHKKDPMLLSLRSHLDFTGTLSEFNPFHDNEKYQKNRLELISKIKEAKLNKDDIFIFVKQWFSSLQINFFEITSENDLNEFGEFLFWLGTLLPSKEVKLKEEEIARAFEKYSLSATSKALHGLHALNEAGRKIAVKHEGNFLERLQKRYDVPLIERNETSIKAHFILDVYKDYEKNENAPHKKKLAIIELLRYGIPYLKAHGAKGYGHKLFFLPDDFDDSEAEIPIDNNPINHLVHLNTIVYNLFIFEKRKKNWQELIDEVIILRENCINQFIDFLNALDSYYKKRRDLLFLTNYLVSKEDKGVKEINSNLNFPQSITDSLGLMSEGNQVNFNNEKVEIKEVSLLTTKFKEFRSLHTDFFGALYNFNWQSIKIILDDIKQARSIDKQFKRITLVNLFKAKEKISNYQQEFRKHFSTYIDSNKLSEMEKQEKKLLDVIVYGWKLYIHPTKLVQKNIKREANKTFEKLKKDFERRIKRDLLKAENLSSGLVDYTPHFNVVDKKLIIVANMALATDQDAALELALVVVKDVIGSCEYYSLKHGMLEEHYNEFWVIPSIYGEVVNTRSYQFNLYHFINEKIENISQLSLIPKEYDPSILEKLDLTIYKDQNGNINMAEMLLTNYGELTINVGIARQLFELTEKSDFSEIGEDIFQKKIEHTTKKAQDSFENLTKLMGKAANIYADYKDKDYTENDKEFLSILSEVHQKILPSNSLSTDEEVKVSLNLEQMTNWKNNLESCDNDFWRVYLYLVQKETIYID